jgi:hypothetical protein
MTSALEILIAVVAGAGVVVGTVVADRAKTDRHPHEQDDRIAALAKELSAAVRDAILARALVAPHDSREAPPPQPTLPTRGQSAEEIKNAIGARFFSEGSDPGWSASTERDVRNQVAAKLPSDARQLGVECRSSLCRVEASVPDKAKFAEYVQSAYLGADGVWSGPTTSTLVHDGRSGDVVAVTYLGRPGAGPIPDPTDEPW